MISEKADLILFAAQLSKTFTFLPSHLQHQDVSGKN